MKKTYFLVVICFLVLFLSATAYCKYETKVTVLKGMVTVKQSKTGQEVIVASGQTSTSGEETLSQPETVKEFPPELEKLSKEEKKEEIKEKKIDIEAYKKIFEEFLYAFSQGDRNKLESLLSEDFTDPKGRSKSTYLRYYEDWFKVMLEAATPPYFRIIRLDSIGSNACRASVERVLYYGQTQYRYEASGIIVKFVESPSGGIQIRSFSGTEPVVLPDFNNNITVEKGSYCNGVLQTQAFWVTTETAALAKPAFVTGSNVTLNILAQTLDIDATAKSGSITVHNNTIQGDVYLFNATGGLHTNLSATAYPNAVLSTLTDVSGLSFQAYTGASFLATAVNNYYLIKSNGNRICRMQITAITTGSITFNYKINPIAGDTSI